jgi:dihydropteroate synthase
MTDSPAYARAGLRLPPCVVAVEEFSPGSGAAALAQRLTGEHLVGYERGIVFLVVLADGVDTLPRLFRADARPVPSGRACDRVLVVASNELFEPKSDDRHPLRTALRDALLASGAASAWRNERGSLWLWMGGMSRTWRIRGGTVGFSNQTPKIVGVLNVTPDSFSDGGRWIDVAAAVEHGESLARAGAALVDVGGESTRPGAERVPAQVQIERVVPVIERLAARVDVPIVVDTTSAEVARAALAAGAAVVNDTSALADDPDLAGVVKDSGAGLILMHRRGAPSTMQEAPAYACCVAEVAESLFDAASAARRAGIAAEQIVVDPGIGFGKRLQDNLDLIGGLLALKSLGFPVMLGASRKSFLGTLTGRGAQDRDDATLATTAAACEAGCELVRVHDAAGSADVVRVLTALRGSGWNWSPTRPGAPPT